jgi:trehalose 6-phosphate synthase
MLRRRFPRATILTFWHIPWPNAERFAICPYQDELLEGLLGSSIVGFQTPQFCHNFLESVDRTLEVRVAKHELDVVRQQRSTLVRSYPISIEWPARWSASAPDPDTCRGQVRRSWSLRRNEAGGLQDHGLQRAGGAAPVERTLDGVGAPDRWRSCRSVRRAARDRSLSRVRNKVHRGGPVERAVWQRQCLRLRSSIGTASHRGLPAYRAADVCYVSSLHDGMNLVAKEFISARDAERGVLMLSRFTGAARELTEAVVVNPYDLEGVADTLRVALMMSPVEQSERMRALRAQVAEFNVYRWAGRMLPDATRLRPRERLQVRLAGRGGHRVARTP